MNEIRVSVIRFGDRKALQLQYVDPITQKKKTKSAQTSDYKEAVKAAGKWEDELRQGRYKPAVKLTWEDFCQRYDDEFLSGKAAKTAQKSRCVRATVEKILSPKRVADLTPERLSYFAAELRRRGCTENTISGYLAHLRSMLAWAVKMKLLHEVPEISMPSRTSGAKGRAISGEEFDRILAKASAVFGTEAAPSFERYLRGLWWSGLRLGESLELYWDRDDRLCVDLTGRRPVIRIPAELEKGNQDRDLPMAPEFQQFLLETPEAERTGRVFKLYRRAHEGERLTDDRICRLISEMGEKAGVKVWTHPTTGKVKYASAHDFRRSFGFRWAQRVMPAQLMEMMRHESIDTTMQFYVGRNAQATADVIWAAYEKATSNTSGNTSPETPAKSEQNA